MFSAIRTLIHQQWAGLLALFLVLTTGTAYALEGSNTVFTDDIVDGEVKEADIGQGAVASPEVKNSSIVGGDVAENTLKGADIDEASLNLSFQGTAQVGTRRTTVPAGGASGQVVLDVPGFGEVRNKNCSIKSARSSFFNSTEKAVDVFTDASRSGTPQSTDPLFAELASGEEAMGPDVEGTDRAIYQVGFGSARVATIVVMGRPDGILCHYQAQAVID